MTYNNSAIVALSLTLMLLCNAAVSQSVTVGGLVTRDLLDETIDILDRDASLPAEQREAVDSTLKSVAKNIDRADAFKQHMLDVRQATEEAPNRTAVYKQQLIDEEKQDYQLADILPGEVSLSAIDSQRTLIEAELHTITARRHSLRQDTAGRDERNAALQSRLVEVQTRLGEVSTPLFPKDGNLEEKSAALYTLTMTDAWLAEVESLKAEIIAEPVLASLRAAELDWLNLSVEQAQHKLKILTDAAQRTATEETEKKLQSIDALEAQLQRENAALQKFVDENRRLVERQQKTTESMDIARANASVLEAQLEALRDDAQLMRQRLEVAGRKAELGRVMSILLNNLPDTRLLQQQMGESGDTISSLSLEIIGLEEERRRLGRFFEKGSTSAAFVGELDEREQVFFYKLLEQRKQLIKEARAAREGLRQLLISNNTDAQNIMNKAHDFEQFLLGNLLWVRSYNSLSLELLQEQLALLFSWEDWRKLPMQAAGGLRASPWTMNWLIALFVVSVLAAHSRRKYEGVVSKPQPLFSLRASHIVLTAAWAMLLVLPWALVVQLIGKGLSNSESPSQFQVAIAPAIAYLAPVVYVLLFLRLLLDENGLGRRLLKWSAVVLERLRSEVRWLGPVLAFSGFISVFASNLDIAAGGSALGALGTFVAAAAVVVAMVRLLRSRLFYDNAMVKIIIQLAAILGVTAVILQAQGFFIAADVYLLSLAESFFAIASIKVISDVLKRCLLVMQLRLERIARSEVQALKEEGEHALEELDDLDYVVSLSDAGAKMVALAQLVISVVALWLIWEPTLPALNLLDTVQLWQVVDSSNAAGALKVISLFDVVLAVLILLVTGLVAKHLPSIVQVVLMEWADADAGVRYASGILSQYLVVGIGLSATLSLIGWDWSRVQWLVAALGVGIGFGLQEIVANFISGLIILFERPIRVGDIVTVGNTSGTVKKIRPRATIIETFEMKEHLVPNKALITGEVTNWSLSEEAVRVMISVGIAYDDDPDLAMRLLVDAAREVDLVLDEPEPFATFDEFGDNGLLLSLRCYVAENRAQAWTTLRSVIFRKYSDANISIAFPQRDVHLNITEPVDIQIAKV